MNEVIERMGGIGNMAALLGVHKNTIYYWKKNPRLALKHADKLVKHGIDLKLLI